MNIATCSLTIALLGASGLISAVAGDAERIFIGQRKLVAAAGNESICTLTPNNQTLEIHLVGNLISSKNGACRGTVQPDGTFGSSCTMPSGVVSYPRGKITGSTITLHTRYVGATTTCEYDTVLQEAK
jgi:hypothetical protein